MSCFDSVRDAKNQRDALLHIAEHIDMLRDLINHRAPAPDPWETGWVSDSEVLAESWKSEQEVGSRPATVDEVQVARLRAELAATTDPEDRLALEAQLRLLTENGAPGGSIVPEGRREQATVTDTDITVDLPPASPARQAQRLVFAATNNLHEYLSVGMGQVEFAKAYAKGGPLWLYEDRAAVMAMPYHVRQALVADIEQDSPARAQEVGRDILKVTTEEQADFAYGQLGASDDA